MTTKHAVMIHLATTDGSASQQMLVLNRDLLFRRSVTGTQRTAWRPGTATNLGEWVAGYIKLAGESNKGMGIQAGPLLIEVSEAEMTDATDNSRVPSALSKRFVAVADAVRSHIGTNPWIDTEVDHIEGFLQEWIDAERASDEAWLRAKTHPLGKVGATPAPAVPATHATTKGTDPDPNPYGWTYEPISVDGFVTRPSGEKYKVRKVEGMIDVEMIRKARLKGHHVFFPGEPGTGKTALAEAAFGEALITMLGTESTEEADYVGAFVPTGDPANPYIWQDGPLVQAMEQGRPFFVDEAFVIDPRVNVILYSATDQRGAHRRGELLVKQNPARGLITAQPGFMVIMASNLNAPGVRPSEAMLDRASLTMEVTTDFGLLATLGVPSDVLNAAENAQTKRNANEVVYVPQSRPLLKYAEQVEDYGRQVALRNLVAKAPEDLRKQWAEALQRTTGVGDLTALSL